MNLLPGAVFDGSTLNLRFYASAYGMTYTPKTSTDGVTWTTTGVTQSVVGTDGHRTATVSMDSPRRFLRLEVAK